MDREKIRRALGLAQSADDTKRILAENGIEIGSEEAERLYGRISSKLAEGAEELSDDELMAVSGGRDYGKDGCAATVEPDSDCWGEDGGCEWIHYSYSHPPISLKCKVCGTYLYRFERPEGSLFKYGLRCRKCGKEYSELDFAGE